MAQLQRIDARLDTLITKLYQVNTHVGRIARRQARLGGFVESPSPPLEASEASEDDDEDRDASSSDTNEMSTWRSYPLSLVTKSGSSFRYESSLT